MLSNPYLSLAVNFFWLWLIIPSVSVAGAYYGSRRKGKRFYSAGDMVALLLLFSLGSFALFMELLASGGLAYYISPGTYVPYPFVSPLSIFVVTLATFVVLFVIFVFISFRLSRRGNSLSASGST